MGLARSSTSLILVTHWFSYATTHSSGSSPVQPVLPTAYSTLHLWGSNGTCSVPCSFWGCNQRQRTALVYLSLDLTDLAQLTLYSQQPRAIRLPIQHLRNVQHHQYSVHSLQTSCGSRITWCTSCGPLHEAINCVKCALRGVTVSQHHQNKVHIPGVLA